MALSQCLDDSPLRLFAKAAAAAELNPQEVYNERHRLALEELLSGGVDDFLRFLGRERLANFLSDDEIQRIRGAAEPARCAASLHGDETAAAELSCSADCSSVTYFPEVSDVEPPLLEIGWPAFTAGSYRGVTRAVAHFQPSYGESIYSCKEAARRMIRNAREVIAIVTDSLTDLDIFKDLQEACAVRRVPVYVLLDQSRAAAFLKMCRNVGVRLDDLRQMRVRTITGSTYYMRSGARITGNVHERFMLIDGNRVATGSYRFDWSDGRLNSSNLVELSGQITEKFDEEFRILYAQSLPINARVPSSMRNSGVYEHLLLKHPAAASPHPAGERPLEPALLTSTPTRGPRASETPSRREPSSPAEGWMEQQQQHLPEEILAGGTALPFPEEEREPMGNSPGAGPCHASTQTSASVTDSDTQTEQRLGGRAAPPTARPPPAQASPDGSLKDCFHKLTRERQHHYSAIRSKLEHMVSALSERRELADVGNLTEELGSRRRQRMRKDCQQEPNPRLQTVENTSMGTWPRARCVH